MKMGHRIVRTATMAAMSSDLAVDSHNAYAVTRGELTIVPAAVNGVSRAALVDGGASLSCLDPRVAAEQGLPVRRGRPEKCVGWFGDQRTTDHYVMVTLTIGSFEAPVCLPLLETPSFCDLVLGKNFLAEFHVIEEHAIGRITSRGRVLSEGTRQADPTPSGTDAMGSPPMDAAPSRGEHVTTAPSIGGSAPDVGARQAAPTMGGPKPTSPSQGEVLTPNRAIKPTRKDTRPTVSGSHDVPKGGTASRIAPPRYDLRPPRPASRRPVDAEGDDDAAGMFTLYDYDALRQWRREGSVEEVFLLRPSEVSPTQDHSAAPLCSLSGDDAPLAVKLEARIRSRFKDRFKKELDHCPPLRHRNFSVELTDDEPLPQRPAYGTTPEGRAALREIIEKMSAAGLIRRHAGPANCPIFLVKKKNLPGQPPRWRAVPGCATSKRQNSRPAFFAPSDEGSPEPLMPWQGNVAAGRYQRVLSGADRAASGRYVHVRRSRWSPLGHAGNDHGRHERHGHVV